MVLCLNGHAHHYRLAQVHVFTSEKSVGDWYEQEGSVLIISGPKFVQLAKQRAARKPAPGVPGAAALAGQPNPQVRGRVLCSKGVRLCGCGLGRGLGVPGGKGGRLCAAATWVGGQLVWVKQVLLSCLPD